MDAKTNRKPIEVKRGNIIVKIYQGNNRVNGVNYPQFTLTYYEGAERKKRRFADLAEARREADFIAEKLSKGEGQVLHLTSVDRTIYVQAIEHLRPLNVPLNVAVLEAQSDSRSNVALVRGTAPARSKPMTGHAHWQNRSVPRASIILARSRRQCSAPCFPSPPH